METILMHLENGDTTKAKRASELLLKKLKHYLPVNMPIVT
jgi:hypothetical protein